MRWQCRFPDTDYKTGFPSVVFGAYRNERSLQPFTPIGSYVAATKSIGFDGVLYFYANNEQVRDRDFEQALKEQLDWKLDRIMPYVVSADSSLVEQICQDDVIHGVDHCRQWILWSTGTKSTFGFG